ATSVAMPNTAIRHRFRMALEIRDVKQEATRTALASKKTLAKRYSPKRFQNAKTKAAIPVQISSPVIESFGLFINDTLLKGLSVPDCTVTGNTERR
ncbi:MAG: hypothetical protein AAF802_11310, partial [Planctomycetota bacterium]